MRKAIITGMNGTVAPAVADALRARDVLVVPWDRSEVSITDESAMAAFIDREAPDVFFHIATGPADWAEKVAQLCEDREIRFLFTGSVSVFSENGTGPYTTDSKPNATDDYGAYKIECERRIMNVNASAYIVRIGWQIGTAPGSNNMIDYLDRTACENGGVIRASNRWFPSCSFLDDTATGLLDILENQPPGLYLLNANRGSTFFDIVSGLKRLRGENWKVEPTDTPSRDDRMFDDGVSITSIEDRLGLVKSENQ